VAKRAPQRVETARLVLTVPSAGDTESIFERYSSDADVTRYLGWPQHRSLSETEAFLDFSAREWKRAPAGPYLIRSREDGSLLGATGLAVQDSREAVTGYVLAKDAWGKGYATEALQAMVDVARSIGLRRLTACCHTEHRASQRVLEKCGFARDSTSCKTTFPNLDPGVRHDAFWYALPL
jgi:[ribosomal protein S5]-alanine N-acetyltransferase